MIFDEAFPVSLAEESIQKKENAEKVFFYLRHNLRRKTNLAELFSEYRSGTIVQKQKKNYGSTHYDIMVRSDFSEALNKRTLMTKSLGK